jgi:hypothetical protein
MVSQPKGKRSPLDRILSLVVPVVVAIVLFPIATLIVAMTLTKILVAVDLYENHVVGGLALAAASGAIVGLAVSIVVVRKLGGVLRKLGALVGSRLPEPFMSCIEFGVTGSALLGGLMLTIILLLGHARPAGWDFQNVLPMMGLGFALFLVVGLPVGLWRRRQGATSQGGHEGNG